MIATRSDLRHLVALLDRSVDAAVFIDADFRIQYCNDAYARLSGRRRMDVEATNPRCHEVLPLEICQTNCAVKRCSALRRSVRMDEIQALPGSAEPRTMIITASLLNEEDGTPMGAVEIYRDVTVEARIQNHYKVLLARARTEQQRLEAEVESRTEALRQAQAQLVHQEKMSSLGRLVAGITHELNNPLNFVSGNLEFLDRYTSGLFRIVDAFVDHDRATVATEMEALDYAYVHTDLPKLLRSVRTGIDRSITIVSNLRSFSHFGHGGTMPTDMDQCFRSTLEIIEPAMRGRVEVRCDLSCLPPVECNPAHINQVFLNLLSNAADAIVGQGSIDVRGLVDGAFAEIAVTDSGVGIPAELLGKVFEPFFTTKPVGSGTGLGLSISYGIVLDHGGTITVDSEPGAGTTFRVRLPIVAPPRPV